MIGDRSAGLHAEDARPLRAVAAPLAVLWIHQTLTRGAGRDFAFAIVRKG